MGESREKTVDLGGGGAPAAGILLTPEEVAALLRVEDWPRHRVRTLLERMRVPVVEVGQKFWRVRSDVLSAALAKAEQRRAS